MEDLSDGFALKENIDPVKNDENEEKIWNRAKTKPKVENLPKPVANYARIWVKRITAGFIFILSLGSR